MQHAEADMVSGELIPEKYALEQNYPNLFNPSNWIKFHVPELNFITLKIIDVLGNEIANLVNEEKSIGSFEIKFDATGLPSGIYFYRLRVGPFSKTMRMVLMK